MPLTRNDVDAYLRYRMQVAGVIQPVFAQSAVKRIYRETGGVPRLINLLADRSLTVAARGAPPPEHHPRHRRDGLPRDFRP